MITVNLPQILQSAVYIVSTSLLYPVILILLGLTAVLVVEIGMFSFEAFNRAGWLKPETALTEKGKKKRLKRFLNFFSKHEPKDMETGVLDAKMLMANGEFEEGVTLLEDCTTKRFVYLFLDDLLAVKDKDAKLNNPKPVFAHLDLFSLNLEKQLQKLELMISKRLERMNVMVRLGPMFGLMGTLIPMGPALLALTRGDINTLASNLIIAFGTTVIGLLIGGLSYFIFTVRTRWYKHDMNEIHYICEVLFGGE
jgi:flagellar motor component MotA